MGDTLSEFFNWLMGFFRQFKLLTIVLPWERAIRVRLGSHVRIWEPGWHIRLPFIDEVQPLNTRLRIAQAGSQTLTTSDGHTLTVSITIGFCIREPALAMLRMHHPEACSSALAMSVVSQLVANATREKLSPGDIEEHVLARLRNEAGYEYEFVRVTDFAYARTYRLWNENSYRSAFSIEERKL